MLENICTSARCAMSLCGTHFTPVHGDIVLVFPLLPHMLRECCQC